MTVISRLQVQRYEKKGIKKSEKWIIYCRQWSFLTYIKKMAAPFGTANI
jgi:hypothetical protein